MRRITPALLLPLFLNACAPSLDPAKDVQRASDLAMQRTGLAPDWKTDNCAAWDGAADLTADQAALYAVSNHREMRAALESIAASRADLVQSGLLPNPVLTLGVAWQFAGTPADTSYGVSITQTLVALLQRDNRMSAADADLEREVISAADLALDIAAKARAGHARVLFAQRQVDQHRAGVVTAERAAEAARKRFAAGEDTTLQVNRQVLLLLQLKARLARAEAELESRKRMLAAAVCRADAPMNWSAVEDPAATAVQFDVATLDESRIIELAAGQRLDTAAAEASARAALARAGMAKQGRFGEITAGIDYAHTDSGSDELGPSLAIPLPIFDTGDAHVAKARAEARRAVQEAEDIREEAILEARLALIAARSAAALAADYESQLVSLAEQNLDLAHRAFTAGEADLTTFLQAEEALVSARSELLDLQETAALARIELARAVGGRIEP